MGIRSGGRRAGVEAGAGALGAIGRAIFFIGPRWRARLVFTGSLLTIGGWFVSWYDIVYRLRTAAAAATVVHTGRYEVLARYEVSGRTQHGVFVQNGYDGRAIVASPLFSHALGVNGSTLRNWLVLAAVTALTLLLLRWQSSHPALRAVRLGLDALVSGAVVVALGLTLARMYRATSFALVRHTATHAIVATLAGRDGGAAAVEKVTVGLSWGFLAMTAGFTLAAVGVFLGNFRDPGDPDPAVADRTKAVLRLVGIVRGLGRLGALGALVGLVGAWYGLF